MGGTRCGRGGQFAFWARLGAPDRLLVFFEGGGGCWDHRSCAPGTALFDDPVDAGDDPSRAAGVLDLDDPRNPFHGWSALFVPSCTGDVFAGDAVRTYRAADGRAVTVHHRGHVNASAALDWMFQRVPDPRRVFVAGCSAGSIGSILHAPRILRQYPQAQVAQLGDSLGYLFSQPTDLRELWGADRLLPDWVPGVRAIPRARFTMPRFYQAVAAHYPRASFAQVNFTEDRVQRRLPPGRRGRRDLQPGPAGQPGRHPGRQPQLPLLPARRLGPLRPAQPGLLLAGERRGQPARLGGRPGHRRPGGQPPAGQLSPAAAQDQERPERSSQ